MPQESTQTEIFKDIPGYEQLYQISNLGRVRSLSRDLYDPKRNLYLRTLPSSIITPVLDGGYFRLNLYKKGKKKAFRVHRLLAMAFIPNPECKSQINHKDGNKSNNDLSNLEWVTPKENVNHAFDIGLMSSTHSLLNLDVKLNLKKKKKKVDQKNIKKTLQVKKEKKKKYGFKKVINIETGEIFPSVKEAAFAIGCYPSKLSFMLRFLIKNTTSLRFLK